MTHAQQSVAQLKTVDQQQEVSICSPLVDNCKSLSQRRSSKTPHHMSATEQASEAKKRETSLDFKLVQRVQAGDKSAFDLLVVKYQGRAAAIVSRYVSDSHEIADVTQEAFIKAYRGIGKFRSDSAFYTWLYRIAVNCAKNYLLSKGRKTPSVDIEMSDAELIYADQGLKDIASPEGQLSRAQLEEVVNQAIRTLPEDLRVALTLREFDGLSYEEIADVMACPVGTVRSRIFRARESVDQAIRASEGGE